MSSSNKWYSCLVVSGAGIGKKLGFPTLNLTFPLDFNYQHGVYAGWVKFSHTIYQGAFHFGPILTFNRPTPILEVFVLDQDIHTTPRQVEISLIKFLRPTHKFVSRQALTTQIKKDVYNTKILLNNTPTPDY